MTDVDKTTPQEVKRSPGVDALFSGIMMLLAALLLLAANLYTTNLWQVKGMLALLMTVLGVGFCWRYARARRGVAENAVETEKTPRHSNSRRV